MLNIISDFMAKMRSTPRMTVGVSVSQSGLLEVAILDKANHCIKNYANRRIKYNAQLREIENIEDFKTQLISIYQELDIVHNSSVILLLPNVFFELTSVPLILDNYSIESVLLGNIEQSYLFKKNEPVLSWVELGKNDRNDNRTIAYSAIQESEILKYLNVFNSIGAKVLAVGNSHFNLINSIKYTQICKKEIESQSPWNTILITNNSFAIFSMSGDKLVEFVEEPVALRSLTSEEEIYSMLVESVSSAMQNYIANSILVISDNDDVDASVICEKLSFHGTKHFLNQNKYATGQIIDTSSAILPNYISQISLYAVSSVLVAIEEEKTINFSVGSNMVSLSKVYSFSFNGIDIEITKEIITAITIFLITLIAMITFSTFGVLKYLDNSNLKKIAEYDNNITEISKEIGDLKNIKKEEPKTIFNLQNVKKTILDNNKKEILYYNALSFNIPRSTWVTHFYVDEKGAVAIEGRTSSTNNVYAFFKGIKTIIEDSDIGLAKLKYASGFEEEILNTKKLLYEFELSNPSYSTTDVSKLEAVTPDNTQVKGVEKSLQDNIQSDDKKGKVPNLPPIEDVKNTDLKNKESVKKEENSNNKNLERLTSEDVEEINAQRDAKKTKSQDNLDLPELPNFDN